MSDYPRAGKPPEPDDERDAPAGTPEDLASDDAAGEGGATAASAMSDTEEIRREPQDRGDVSPDPPSAEGLTDDSGVTQQLRHGDAPTAPVTPVTPPPPAQDAGSDVTAPVTPPSLAEDAEPDVTAPETPPGTSAPSEELPTSEPTAPPPLTEPPPAPPSREPVPPPPPSGPRTPPPLPPDEPTPPPGPPPVFTQQPRRLTRRGDDRVLGGVASGLGDYFGIDPAIVRLVFVALAFAGGSGVILYLLAWVLMPERTTGTSIGEQMVERFGGGWSVVGVILIGIAVLTLMDTIGVFDGDLVWVAILLGIGVLLFRQKQGHDTPAHTDPPPESIGSQTATLAARASAAAQSPSAPPASTGRVDDPAFEPISDPLFDPLYDSPSGTATWRPTPAPPPAAPPRPPSILGRATVATALVVVGFAALLANLTRLSLSVAEYMALALTVVGFGLIIGARRGRARGLIVLGLLLVVLMAITAAVPSVPVAGTGERMYAPQTLAELRDTYALGMGQLTLDLTQLQVQPGQRMPPIEALLGTGQLVVEVPQNATVDLDAATNLGAISVFGEIREGTNVTVDRVFPGTEGGPTIPLELVNRLGETQVIRAPAGAN